jgi:hypothetical protein
MKPVVPSTRPRASSCTATGAAVHTAAAALLPGRPLAFPYGLTGNVHTKRTVQVNCSGRFTIGLLSDFRYATDQLFRVR